MGLYDGDMAEHPAEQDQAVLFAGGERQIPSPVDVPLNERKSSECSGIEPDGDRLDSEISFALNFESAVNWRPFAQRFEKGVFGDRWRRARLAPR